MPWMVKPEGMTDIDELRGLRNKRISIVADILAHLATFSAWHITSLGE